MNSRLSNLLTHSRMSSFKTCPRKHQFEYELGFRRDRDAQPLRMGQAVHEGLDVMKRGGSLDEACQAVYANYAELPTWANTPDLLDEWRVECQTVVRLLAGWQWRWGTFGLKQVVSEYAFNLPLVNPETGASSRTWRIAGKIDGIVELPDGRLAVLEHKTTSEDLSIDGDYWRRLRIDQQISLYYLAARAMGYEVQTVIYDVLRKPSIAPKIIADLDAAGCKIVIDSTGNRVFKKDGSPRETGDSEKGYIQKVHRETAEEFGERLSADMAERPDFYFARQEIPRLDADIEQFRYELWDIGKQIAADRPYRNTSACTMFGRCPYLDVCHLKVDREMVPAGFIRVTDVHPELETVHVVTHHADPSTAAASFSPGSAIATDTAPAESGCE